MMHVSFVLYVDRNFWFVCENLASKSSCSQILYLFPCWTFSLSKTMLLLQYMRALWNETPMLGEGRQNINMVYQNSIHSDFSSHSRDVMKNKNNDTVKILEQNLVCITFYPLSIFLHTRVMYWWRKQYWEILYICSRMWSGCTTSLSLRYVLYCN